jgi:Sulfatase
MSMPDIIEELGNLKRLLRTLSIIAIAAAADAAHRPNSVMIVADDMGFSDMGAFGGEIRMLNLDASAGDGMYCTNFYTAPKMAQTQKLQ